MSGRSTDRVPGDEAPLPEYVAWREEARRYLLAQVAPDGVQWRAAEPSLLAPTLAPSAVAHEKVRLPRRFIELAEAVACHRSTTKWDALYRVMWRLAHGERSLLDVATDPDVHVLLDMERAVRRATHKMHAFVRFRRVESLGAVTSGENNAALSGQTHCDDVAADRLSESPDDSCYVAWFEPSHLVVERGAPFFARRFTSMRWSILTPDGCAHWDRVRLTYSPGISREHAPQGDTLEELWRIYYANIFNPARLSTDVMRGHMPRRYWRNLPESSVIAELAREAPRRVREMIERVAATPEALPDDLRAGPVAPDHVAPDDKESPVTSTPNDASARATSHRSNVGAVPATSARAVALQQVLAKLNDPSQHDPTHDPGARSARNRAEQAVHAAPVGLTIDGRRVVVGVAGFTDPTLLADGVFYPRGASGAEERLRYYASRFPMVEVDATYYALPSRATSVAWVDRTPSHFTFHVKAHALMTGHPTEVRRLPDWLRRALPRDVVTKVRMLGSELPDELRVEVWRRYLAALEPLQAAGKLGAIFLQFPHWFTPSRASADVLRRAREFLGKVRAAVEFRNPAWLAPRVTERTLALLRELDFAYTIVDAPPGTASSMPNDVHVTSSQMAVMRLHGRRVETWERHNALVTERYRYLYDRSQLQFWTTMIGIAAKRLPPPSTVHVVYNNNHANYATTNALETMDLVNRRWVLRDGQGEPNEAPFPG